MSKVGRLLDYVKSLNILKNQISELTEQIEEARTLISCSETVIPEHLHMLQFQINELTKRLSLVLALHHHHRSILTKIYNTPLETILREFEEHAVSFLNDVKEDVDVETTRIVPLLKSIIRFFETKLRDLCDSFHRDETLKKQKSSKDLHNERNRAETLEKQKFFEEERKKFALEDSEDTRREHETDLEFLSCPIDEDFFSERSKHTSINKNSSAKKSSSKEESFKKKHGRTVSSVQVRDEKTPDPSLKTKNELHADHANQRKHRTKNIVEEPEKNPPARKKSWDGNAAKSHHFWSIRKEKEISNRRDAKYALCEL